jgi:hypothetical protein
VNKRKIWVNERKVLRGWGDVDGGKNIKVKGEEEKKWGMMKREREKLGK